MVKVGSSVVGKTGVIENTLDPKWDKMLSFAFHATNVGIHIDLFDFNPIQANKSLGSTSVFIEDVLPLRELHKQLDGVVDVNGKPEKGRVEGLYPVIDVVRQAQLDIMKKDGFQVDFSAGHLSADIWAPIYQQKVELAKKVLDVVTFQGGDKGEVKQKGHVHLLADFLPVVKSRIIRIDKRKKREVGSLEMLADKVAMQQSVIRAMTPVPEGVEESVSGEIVSQDGSHDGSTTALPVKNESVTAISSQPLHESTSGELLAANSLEVLADYRTFLVSNF